ncbi:hypothetical protein [Actinomadura soli]|uniref:hypothetical protein n=1 Tax=Actinomadura soli TaxID=2508997 RepID=UPI0014874E7A|nr:hypothetical protein [Actinomadura soli]
MGDPACDLLTPWTFLPAGVRDGYRDIRDILGVDEATWARGRGWGWVRMRSAVWLG